MKRIAQQHGDVVLVCVKEVPNGAIEVKIQNGYILERGEGVHTHCIEDVSGVKVYEKDGEIYVSVDKQTALLHEEHGRQTVKPGIVSETD